MKRSTEIQYRLKVIIANMKSYDELDILLRFARVVDDQSYRRRRKGIPFERTAKDLMGIVIL